MKNKSKNLLKPIPRGETLVFRRGAAKDALSPEELEDYLLNDGKEEECLFSESMQTGQSTTQLA